VGYGDYFPATTAGRLFVGFPTMFLGVGLLGYILSLGGASVLESRALEVRGLKNITSENHVVICGFASRERLGKLIAELRRDVATADCDIVVIDDRIDELPRELRSADVLFVKGDAGRETVLAQANLMQARSTILQASLEQPQTSDDRNLKIALAVECYNPGVFTVAECVNPENEPYFRRANVDAIVCVSSLSEQMLVQELQDPGISSVVSELTSNACGKQIYMVDVPSDCHDYAAVRETCERHQTLALGVRRDGVNHLLPADSLRMQPADQLIIVADQRPDFASSRA
jgi:voltage-gated potassium channel